jgi:hypothetical protein
MARFLGSSIFQITVIPPTNKISESSSNVIYRNTDEVRWRNGINRVNCDSGRWLDSSNIKYLVILLTYAWYYMEIIYIVQYFFE